MSQVQSQNLEDTEEGRAFLQVRLSKFAKGAAMGGLVFLVLRSVVSLAYNSVAEFKEPSFWFHAVGIAGGVFIWLVCRRGSYPRRTLVMVEGLGLLISAIGYELMGMTIPVWTSPEKTTLLALLVGQVIRAIYVPSTPKRTMAFGTMIGIPYVTSVYWHFRNVDFIAWSKMTGVGGPGISDLGIFLTIQAGMWWLVTVAICTSASSIIYGLRTEMKHIKRLGQYTLLEKLGEGGMGVVYRAKHERLRRPTAIKLMSDEQHSPEQILRFEREVQLTAQLTHPNTVTIYDYGRSVDGRFYYAMELLDGDSLQTIIDGSGPMPAERTIWILKQAAQALAEAHGIGLIHRDIKPANLVLCKRGGLFDVVKIVDFGLVKDINAGAETSVTKTGVVTGTPLYMAPEVITAPDSIDGRSDLYALGAVGYFMLTGKQVFEGATVIEVCSHHLHTTPVPPSERLGSDVPKGLEQLLLGCLAKSPSQRPENANVFLERLAHEARLVDWTQAQASQWWAGWSKPKVQPSGQTGQSSAFDSTVEVALDVQTVAQNIGHKEQHILSNTTRVCVSWMTISQVRMVNPCFPNSCLMRTGTIVGLKVHRMFYVSAIIPGIPCKFMKLSEIV
jgi:eukaryotic-like serine/threonine-protein kinase